MPSNFLPLGGVIRIECQKNEDINAIIFRVSDQGSGIEPEKIQNLFKPFSQLSNARYIEEAGTGLGLMIIKKIADMHNGNVGIENNPSLGATFWIEIPQPEFCQLSQERI